MGDPEKEARALTNRIAEVDRKRSAYQDLVAEGLMEREELRAKLDALSHQKAAAEAGLNTLEERRRKVRELQLSREKILARYREVVPEALEEAGGNARRAVYNTLGATVWAAKAKGDPIKIVFSTLGGEEVCRSDATSRRSASGANPPLAKGFGFDLVLPEDAPPETSLRVIVPSTRRRLRVSKADKPTNASTGCQTTRKQAVRSTGSGPKRSGMNCWSIGSGTSEKFGLRTSENILFLGG